MLVLYFIVCFSLRKSIVLEVMRDVSSMFMLSSSSEQSCLLEEVLKSSGSSSQEKG